MSLPPAEETIDLESGHSRDLTISFGDGPPGDKSIVSTPAHQGNVITESDINILIPDIEQGNTYYCQICMDDNPYGGEFKMTECHHIFCKECITNFLKSKIVDGQVYPKCFYITKTPIPDKVNEFEDKTCSEPIPMKDIETLFASDDTTLEKYRRYIYAKENKTARECPNCTHIQLGTPDITPVIICEKCACKYCFFHANAHDFEKFPTCEAYEASIAKDSKSTVDFIKSNSKACPGCGVHVMKTGGCNHMKCQCGVAFCWLCGKQIDDSTFPAHFQWWNPAGCANLQMNEAIEPSFCARFLARILAIGQLLVLGPLTFASTIVSSCVCCCCIYVKLRSDKKPINCSVLQETFNVCMSSWGIVWMILLFVVPIGLAFGAVVGSLAFSLAVICYPCYASYRLAHNEYPWPNRLSRCCRRFGRRCCDNNCTLCCCRMLDTCFCWWRRDTDERQQEPDRAPSNRNSMVVSRSPPSVRTVIDTQPDDAVPSHVPSHLSETVRINSLGQQAEMLDQMNELLNLMEQLERMQQEQRRKKDSEESEVTTPLVTNESGGLIRDNNENTVDLEYEEHRFRLQMLIDQMCNMNSPVAVTEDKESMPVTLPKEAESPSHTENVEISTTDILLDEVIAESQSLIPADTPDSSEKMTSREFTL